MKCPICKDKRVTPVPPPGRAKDSNAVVSHIAFGVPILQCNSCGFMFADFIHPQVIEFLYRGFGRSGTSEEKLQELRDMGEHFAEAQMRFMKPHLPENISCALDFGGGMGAMTDRLTTIADEVWISELDKPAIEKIDHSRGIKFVTNDGLADDSFAGKFDLVILSNVLEHMNNPLMQIARFSRLCKPGGLFFIEVPFEEKFVRGTGGHLMQHILFFSPYTLRRAIATQGSFDIVAFNQSGPPVDEMIAERKLIHRPEADETEDGWVIRTLLRNARPVTELPTDSLDMEDLQSVAKALSLQSMTLVNT